METNNKSREMRVVWTKPTDNGQSITHYKLFVNQSQTPYATVATTGAASQETVLAGLTNGATAEITVKAQNSVGDSLPSVAKEAVPRAVPDAPVNVSATATGKDSAKVSWSEPASNGDAVINYKISYTVSGSSTVGERIYTAAQVQQEDGKSYVAVDSLVKGTTYTFQVAAENGAGYGSLSGHTTMAMTTTWKEPSIPGNNQAQSLGDNQVKVAWEKPTDNNGSPIEKYIVYIYDNADAADQGIKEGQGFVGNKVVAGVDNLTTTIEDLTSGKIYYFRVSAVNGVGESGLGGPCSTAAKGAPGRPLDVQVTVDSDTQMTVTWQPASANGGIMQRYEFMMYDALGLPITPGQGGIDYAFPDNNNGLAEQKVVVTGLSPYSQYKYTVTAVNDAGANDGDKAGFPAETEYRRTMRVPFAPTGVKANPTGQSGQLQVSWTAPAQDVGTPLIDYTIYLQDSEGILTAKAQHVTGTQAVLDNLANGTDYTIIVKARNGIGLGDAAEPAVAAPFRPAQMPLDIKAVITSGTTADLSWTAPADNGGSAIQRYQVLIYNESGQDVSGQVTVDYGEDQTATTARLSGLNKGEAYKFQVAAVTGTTATGQVLGLPVESNTIVMWRDPSAPQEAQAAPTNQSGEVAVTWQAPADDGDTVESDALPENHTSILAYYISYRAVGIDGASWSKTEKITPAPAGEANRYVLTGLDDYTVYQITVNAENGAGEGLPSEAVTATSRSVPGAPVIEQVLTGDSAATITKITPNDKNGGDPVTAYHIYATKAGSTEAILKATVDAADGEPLTNVTVPGLINGDDYTIAVRAVNGACVGENQGGGPASNEINVRVGMPLAPENLNVSLGTNLAVLVQYDAATDNGSPIDHYNIYVKTNGGAEEIIAFEDIQGMITGKENGDTITIRASAVNAVGESPITEPKVVVVGASTTPVIENVLLHSNSVDVTWDAVTSNGNKMQSYRVYLNGKLTQIVGKDVTSAVLSQTGNPVLNADGSVGSETVDLEAGKNYTVEISSINMAGESPKSAPWSFTFAVPQAPGIQDVTFGAGELTVEFKAPSDNGGAQVLGYHVYIDGVKTKLDLTVGAYNAPDWAYNEATETYTAIVKGLANGTVYNVQVAAYNQYGEGALSVGKIEAPATLASEPREVTAKAASATTAELTWKAPSYDGGSGITAYHIDVLDGAGNVVASNHVRRDAGIVIIQTSPTTTRATFEGLEKGADYAFVVQAKTRASLGAEAKSNRITTFIEPQPPVIKSVSSGNTNSSKLPVTVVWDAPQDNGGSQILGYNVYSGGVKKNSELVTGNQFTIENMNRGRVYRITVRAVNSVGESVDSKEELINVGSPAAPVVTSITTDESSYTVNWQVVEGVTQGYRIYEVDEQGGASILMSINNAETTTANIDDQRPGDVHYIYMTAYNDLGDGAKTEVYQVVVGSPSAVELTAVEPGYQAVDVSWTKPSVPGGVGGQGKFAVAGYEVWYADQANDTAGRYQLAATIDDPDVTNLTITGLDGGKTYDVKVRAFNSVGDSGKALGLFSAALSATPWSEPDLPEITDIIPGNNEFTMRFTQPDGNGLRISGYKVFWGQETAAGEAPAQLTEIPAESLEFNGNTVGVSNVENGVVYYVYVAAVTTPPTGLEDLVSVAPAVSGCNTVITGIPAAPAFTAVLPGDGKVDVAFTKPVTVGTAITGYKLRYCEYDRELGKEIGEGVIVDCSDTKATLTNLTNSKTYVLQVKALNSTGESPWSAQEFVTIGTPAAPVITEITGGNGFAELAWTVPDSNASDIYIYRIYADGEFVKEATSPYAQLTGLVNGTKYLLQVSAVNKEGESVKSDPRAVTPGTVPDLPQNVQARATGSHTIEITWEKPLTDGGLPIANYVVLGSGVLADNSNVEYNGLSAVVSGLREGASYQFSVQAVNAAGQGNPAAMTSPVTTFTKPTSPTWDSISSANATITAEWFAPSETGGTEILGYNVYVNGEKNNTDLIVQTEDNSNPETGAVSYLIENAGNGKALELGTKYRIYITAVNAVGEGTASDALSIVVNGALALTEPGRPTNLEAVPGNREINLTWKAPLYDGNSPITSYQVYLNGEWKFTTDGGTVSQRVTGLSNGTNYDFYVKAVNAQGVSLPSASVTAAPVFIEAPGAPEEVTYKNNSTMNLMTVTWKTPNGYEDDKDLSYNVYVNKTLIASGLKSTEVTMEVTSGITYKIMVEAVNQGGVTPSRTITALNSLNVMSDNIHVDTNLDVDCDGVQDKVDEAKAPGAPGNLGVKKDGSASVTLTWTEPGNNGGADIESYNIYVNGNVTNVSVADLKGSLSYVIPTMPNSTYTLMVAAVNEVGEGVKSSPLAVFVAASTAPTNLQADLNRENSSISLSWKAPVNVEVEAYKIYVNGMEATTTTNCSYTYSGSKNKEYIFRVSAVVKGDESRQSDYALVSTMIVTPGAPQLSIGDPADNTVTLNWEPPAQGDISHYTLYINGEAATDQYARIDASLNTLDYVMESNRDYAFQLAAVAEWQDESGITQTRLGQKSNVVNASTVQLEPDAPAAPTLQSVMIDKNSDGGYVATLTWLPVAIPEGADRLDYHIYINGQWEDTYDGSLNTQAVAAEEESGTEQPDTPLEEPSVATADNNEPGPLLIMPDESISDNAENQETVPAAENSGENAATNVGTEETGGETQAEQKANQPVQALVALDSSESIAWASDFNLQADTDYIFQVSAVAVTGSAQVEGARSNPISETTKQPVEIPNAPTNLTAVLLPAAEGQPAKIHLEWTAPEGPDFAYYQLSSDGQKQRIEKTETAYDYVVIKGKTEYAFTVAAVNAAGSAKSEVVTISTKEDGNEPQPDIAGPPTITGSVSDGSSRVAVLWSQPTENAAGITGYTVSKDSAPVVFAAGTMVLMQETWTALEAETAILPASARGVLFCGITDDQLHPVVVAAVKEVTQGEDTITWTGTYSNTWNLSRNLNIDENAGPDTIPQTPSQNIDADGNGSVDVIGKVVKLTGTIESGGPDVVPEVHVINSYGEKIATGTVTDNTFVAEITVGAGSGNAPSVPENTPLAIGLNLAATGESAGETYQLVVTKDKCTSYTITDIAINVNVNEVDLGRVVLYAGDINNDGYVDFLDMMSVTENYNQSGLAISGDANNDNYVDFLDMMSVTENFGKTAITISNK